MAAFTASMQCSLNLLSGTSDMPSSASGTSSSGSRLGNGRALTRIRVIPLYLTLVETVPGEKRPGEFRERVLRVEISAARSRAHSAGVGDPTGLHGTTSSVAAMFVAFRLRSARALPPCGPFAHLTAAPLVPAREADVFIIFFFSRATRSPQGSPLPQGDIIVTFHAAKRVSCADGSGSTSDMRRGITECPGWCAPPVLWRRREGCSRVVQT